VQDRATPSLQPGITVDHLVVGDRAPDDGANLALERPRVSQVAWALVTAALVFAAVATSWSRIFYSDTFISLTSGRYIIQHGLPAVDHLTVAGSGRPWLDQQWLAHVLMYELWHFAGNAAVGAASAAAFAVAFGMLAWLLASRGSSPLALLVSLGAPLVLCLLFAETRAQSFAYPLFVGLLWVLLREGRRQWSPRSAIVLPILVIWSNTHGSVLLGIALCLGFFGLRSMRSLRTHDWGLAAGDITLSILAAASVLATPYGTAIVGYYTRVLGDPALATIAEWQGASFAPLQAPFIALLLGAVGFGCFAWGRGFRPPSEILMVAVPLGALATHAVRYQTWFALGVAPLLALAVTQVSSGRRISRPPKAILVAGAGLILAGTVVASGILATTRPATFDRFVSESAVQSAARYAALHQGTHVLADDVTGSALLWRYPKLGGRVGFDARTEVYEPSDFLEFARFLTMSGQSWMSASKPYQIIAVTCSLHPNLCRALPRISAWRVISHRAGGLVAVKR
jgi:hypothetical protein